MLILANDSAMVQIMPTHTCFDDALDFITLIAKQVSRKRRDQIWEKYFIVHAVCIMPSGKPYAHAWVESADGICIFRCIINGESMYLEADKNEYYAEFNVKQFTRYTLQQAMEENRKHNNYGPWKAEYLTLTVQKGEVPLMEGHL